MFAFGLVAISGIEDIPVLSYEAVMQHECKSHHFSYKLEVDPYSLMVNTRAYPERQGSHSPICQGRVSANCAILTELYFTNRETGPCPGSHQ